MLYGIRHRTTYDYDYEVPLSHHVAHLTPRSILRQCCRQHRIESLPAPTSFSTHTDHFGNPATFLTIEGAHRKLSISAVSVVEMRPVPAVKPLATQPWELVRDLCRTDSVVGPIEPAEFIFSSPLVPRRREFTDYALASFEPDRPTLDAACDLMRRIYTDFVFDTKATTVMTQVFEFFKVRHGVCQDFAHFMVACLRSLGLPARYVSGYLETLPPPGKPKLVGADASHAWVSVWCGDRSWVDLDPTNDTIIHERHITTAWGRDYSDISPVRGVIVGSGGHSLSVEVDVQPMSDRRAAPEPETGSGRAA